MREKVSDSVLVEYNCVYNKLDIFLKFLNVVTCRACCCTCEVEP